MPTVREIIDQTGLSPQDLVRVATSSSNPTRSPDTRIIATSTSHTGDSTLLSEKEQAARTRIGRGIYGQNSYPVGPETDPELWDWYQTIWNAAQEGGLDPFPVVFWVYKRDMLLQAAARGGFPVNIPHWRNGMEFRQLSKQHQYRLAKIYELVVNTNPSHAYLMDGNEIYDQKLVIAHVMGHSDFFKHNIWFGHTNRNMMNRIAEHADYVRRIQEEQGIPFDAMEKFLERAFSIDNLIDRTNLEPEPITYDVLQTKEPDPVPDDFALSDTRDMPKHVAKRFNDPARIAQERIEEKRKRELELTKTPKHPTADVLGFVIKNSTVLPYWQRKILEFVREQAHYFAPQGATKIMNEGWAVYWHQKLMASDGIKDLCHVASVADHNSGTLAMSGTRLNPYALGVAIFKDIEDRWNKGRHGREWDLCENREERRNWDTGEMQGKKKIFDVRRRYKDTEFVNEFLTPQIARDLNLYTFDKNDQSGYYEIASRQFLDVKNRLVEMLSNGGNPLIEVQDGNYNDSGELLLKHVYAYDLDQAEANETLKNLLFMWGKPIHLNTKISKDGEVTPVRITADFVLLVDNDKQVPGIRIRHFELYDHGASTEPLHTIKEEIDEEDLDTLTFKIQ